MTDDPREKETGGPADIPGAAIEQEPIELYKILKMENWVGSGGEAKFVIAEGQVLVNNTVETRKRKKLFAGDTVEFGGRIIQIRLKPSPNTLPETSCLKHHER